MPSSMPFSYIAPWLSRACGNTQAATTPCADLAGAKPPGEGPPARDGLLRERARSADDARLAPVAVVAAPPDGKAGRGEQPSQREVPIDCDTVLPYELYKDLVRAGRRAKMRGQHELHESPHGSGGRGARHLRNMSSAPF
mmetsp:Transcript_43866/g.116385  ORF Transcript_43866/g.116385 Transcript_43866/m.116385 type:complete len:140 (-) Transcript_43866:263-682(-)